MGEVQINSMIIKQVDLSHLDTGGACRTHQVEILVDKTNNIYRQRRDLVHEILGAYLGTFIEVETLTEMAEAICDGLDELSED